MATTKKPNVLQRMNAVMEEVKYVQKEKGSGMPYRAVTHDSVTALLRPALVKHGLVAVPHFMHPSQDGNRTELQMVVRIYNIDDKEDFVDIPSFGYGIDQQDKGPGKAISYAFKYALLKGFNLETGDDPDLGESGDHKPAVKSKSSKAERTKRITSALGHFKKEFDITVTDVEMRFGKNVNEFTDEDLKSLIDWYSTLKGQN